MEGSEASRTPNNTQRGGTKPLSTGFYFQGKDGIRPRSDVEEENVQARSNAAESIGVSFLPTPKTGLQSRSAETKTPASSGVGLRRGLVQPQIVAAARQSQLQQPQINSSSSSRSRSAGTSKRASPRFASPALREMTSASKARTPASPDAVLAQERKYRQRRAASAAAAGGHPAPSGISKDPQTYSQIHAESAHLQAPQSAQVRRPSSNIGFETGNPRKASSAKSDFPHVSEKSQNSYRKDVKQIGERNRREQLLRWTIEKEQNHLSQKYGKVENRLTSRKPPSILQNEERIRKQMEEDDARRRSEIERQQKLKQEEDMRSPHFNEKAYMTHVSESKRDLEELERRLHQKRGFTPSKQAPQNHPSMATPPSAKPEQGTPSSVQAIQGTPYTEARYQDMLTGVEFMDPESGQVGEDSPPQEEGVESVQEKEPDRPQNEEESELRNSVSTQRTTHLDRTEEQQTPTVPAMTDRHSIISTQSSSSQFQVDTPSLLSGSPSHVTPANAGNLSGALEPSSAHSLVKDYTPVEFQNEVHKTELKLDSAIDELLGLKRETLQRKPSSRVGSGISSDENGERLPKESRARKELFAQDEETPAQTPRKAIREFVEEEVSTPVVNPSGELRVESPAKGAPTPVAPPLPWYVPAGKTVAGQQQYLELSSVRDGLTNEVFAKTREDDSKPPKRNSWCSKSFVLGSIFALLSVAIATVAFVSLEPSFEKALGIDVFRSMCLDALEAFETEKASLGTFSQQPVEVSVPPAPSDASKHRSSFKGSHNEAKDSEKNHHTEEETSEEKDEEGQHGNGDITFPLKAQEEVVIHIPIEDDDDKEEIEGPQHRGEEADEEEDVVLERLEEQDWKREVELDENGNMLEIDDEVLKVLEILRDDVNEEFEVDSDVKRAIEEDKGNELLQEEDFDEEFQVDSEDVAIDDFERAKEEEFRIKEEDAPKEGEFDDGVEEVFNSIGNIKLAEGGKVRVKEGDVPKEDDSNDLQDEEIEEEVISIVEKTEEGQDHHLSNFVAPIEDGGIQADLEDKHMEEFPQRNQGMAEEDEERPFENIEDENLGESARIELVQALYGRCSLSGFEEKETTPFSFLVWNAIHFIIDVLHADLILGVFFSASLVIKPFLKNTNSISQKFHKHLGLLDVNVDDDNDHDDISAFEEDEEEGDDAGSVIDDSLVDSPEDLLDEENVLSDAQSVEGSDVTSSIEVVGSPESEGSGGLYRAVEFLPIRGTPLVQMRHVRRSRRNAGATPLLPTTPMQIPAQLLRRSNSFQSR